MNIIIDYVEITFPGYIQLQVTWQLQPYRWPPIQGGEYGHVWRQVKHEQTLHVDHATIKE